MLEGLAADRIAQTLRYHGLTSLVAALSETATDLDLEPAPLATVRQDALAYAAQAMAWEAEWRQLLSCELKVPILVLKGAALGHTLYPHSHWRMLGDLDLLIEPAQRARCEAALKQAGYAPSLSTGGDLVFSEQQYVRQLGRGLQSLVDLHWALSNRPVLGAWNSCQELWINGIEMPRLGARGLGARDALLQACVHRTGHHRRDGDRLIWLLDIHLLWAALGAAGKAELVAAAQAKGLSALLLDGLNAASTWFDTEVDSALRHRLRDAGASDASARLLSAAPNAWQDLVTLKHWRDRFKYLGQVLFPPRAYMKRRYPGRHPVVYLYLRRCWDGLRKNLGPRP